MTTPGSPVTTVAGFTIPGFGSLSPETILIYQTDPAVPERIEAVNFTIDYSDAGNTGSVFAIQLCDQAGNALDVAATPIFSAPDSGEFKMYFSWSRRGNDTANEALVIAGPYNGDLQFGYINCALPDIVLGTNSLVNLLSWRNVSGEEQDLVVTDCVITRTPNAGAVSTSSTVTGIPLLTATDDQ